MEEESLAEFYYNALGLRYAVLLPVAALTSFVIALAVVSKGKGPTVGPALVLSVLAPLILAFMGMVDGITTSYMVIAKSTTAPSPAELAMGWSYALASLHIGVMLSIPTLLVALFGATIRALFSSNQP